MVEVYGVIVIINAKYFIIICGHYQWLTFQLISAFISPNLTVVSLDFKTKLW